jgi:bifunctional aspartokinase / homoserine dehydrogenase 1
MTNSAAFSRSVSLNLNQKQTANIFIAGVGAVGGTLIRQIQNLSDSDKFNIIGVCDSSRTLWLNGEKKSINKQALSSGKPKNWSRILKKLTTDSDAELIFVDATGDPEVAGLYVDFFKKGIHIVTPSKIANTRKQAYFNLLKKTASDNNVRFLYETNVGAGLPVIRTVQDLVKSGDTVTEISGVLSGTMTYIFSQLDAGHSFSETVIRARQLGYAEPDPRDDLSGEDVARKMMILSRVSGYAIEREELNVESITPEALKNVDSATFLSRLKEFDDEWKKKLELLKADGKTLRYTGTMKKNGINVGLQEVEIDSPLGRLYGTNNVIQIKTRRYDHQPLIIQGPGAGKEVTSAGVLADIRQILRDG